MDQLIENNFVRVVMKRIHNHLKALFEPDLEQEEKEPSETEAQPKA